MRAKKAKEPARLIRYWLLADRKMKRISLRRVSPPQKKATKAKKAPRSARSKRGSGVKHAPRTPRATDRLVMVVGAIGVLGVAALIAARQPSRTAAVNDVPTVTTAWEVRAMPESIAPADSKAPAPHRLTVTAPEPESKKAAIASAPPKAKADVQIVRTSTNAAPVRESAKAVRATGPAPVAESTPKTAVEFAPNAVVDTAPSVTITGCLELDSRSFWLKDTTGADAPTSRNWRSGFLKKRPARIEIIDTTNALELPSYIGQRVAATGMLVNREMQMRSVSRVAFIV